MAKEYYNNGGPRATSAINILAGLWLIVSPFLLHFSNASSATRNNIIVGIVVLALAAIGLAAGHRAAWSRWLTFVLGIWLFFAPFILGYTGVSKALWNNIILGSLIVIFSAWSASLIPYRGPEHPEHR